MQDQSLRVRARPCAYIHARVALGYRLSTSTSRARSARSSPAFVASGAFETRSYIQPAGRADYLSNRRPRRIGGAQLPWRPSATRNHHGRSDMATASRLPHGRRRGSGHRRRRTARAARRRRSELASDGERRSPGRRSEATETARFVKWSAEHWTNRADAAPEG